MQGQCLAPRDGIKNGCDMEESEPGKMNIKILEVMRRLSFGSKN